MRRLALVPLSLLLLPASAFAQAEAPIDVSGAGGARIGLEAARFSVSPGSLVAGQSVTVSVRAEGPVKRAEARVTIGRKVLSLGRIRTGNTVTRQWKPSLSPGRYKARLAVRAGGLKRVRTFPVTVTAAPAPVPVVASKEGVFPVRGAYTFGGSDATFGAGRGDHRHQGQDVTAAEGTPLVAPVSGSVYFRKVQPGGAGHYLVIRGGDGTDYVFMHLVAGSELVERGDPVKAGQQIAQVGNTGRSSGPHLHFEIWPDGWYAKGSKPIDPLPTLKAWAAA